MMYINECDRITIHNKTIFGQQEKEIVGLFWPLYTQIV